MIGGSLFYDFARVGATPAPFQSFVLSAGSRDRLGLWRRNRHMNGGPQLQALKIRPNATLKVAAIRSGGLSWRPLSFSTPCLFMADFVAEVGDGRGKLRLGTELPFAPLKRWL